MGSNADIAVVTELEKNLRIEELLEHGIHELSGGEELFELL